MKSEVEIILTPTELARMFWEMDSGQQGNFFVELGRCSDNGSQAEMQWIDVKDYLLKESDDGDIGIKCIMHIASCYYSHLLGNGEENEIN